MWKLCYNKLIKLKPTILPIFLSILTVISGCGVNRSHQTEQSVSTSSVPTYNDIFMGMENLYSKNETPPNLELLEQNVVISSDGMVELNELINQETHFKDSEYFEVDKALEEYEYYTATEIVSNNVIENGQVNVQKLYEIVLRNNAAFIEEGVNRSIYEPYSNEKIKYICELVSDTINKKITEIDKNLNVLDYTLSNLKIFQFDKYVYASVTKDGCLAVNEDFISTLQNENAFEKVIVHESIHLVQKGLTSDTTGVNYRFPDLNVNSLYNEWFIETCAEKNASYYNQEEFIYINEMRYLDALIIATAFESIDVENVNFGHGLKEFYSLLNCNGLISDREIANMMYAVNFAINENMEVIENYKALNGEYMPSSEIRHLKNIYSSKFFETLSKKLYYDLCKQSLSLKDIFSVISLFENSCSNIIWYTDSYKLEENKSFIENYNKIQSCYFELLARELEISADEVAALYNYYNETEEINMTCTNRVEHLNYIYSKMKQRRTFGINRIYERLVSANEI